MLRIVVGVFIILSAFSVVAQACETDKFSGFYSGVSAGYTAGDYDFEYAGSTGDLEGSGAALGGYIGYNYQCGAFVYGIEGDGFWSNSSDDFADGTDTIEAETGYLASVRGRIGYDFKPVMFYATAGIGFTDVDLTLRESGVESGAFSDSATGFVVGGGVESMISDMFSMRLEALYYRFGEVISVTDTDGDTFTVDHNPIVVRAGVAIHFK